MSEQEEATFWERKLLGTISAKSLFNTIYFYNGKVFGLRGGDHRNVVVNNFEIGSSFIKFEENASKTYHGGLCDIKYMCHEWLSTFVILMRKSTSRALWRYLDCI